MILQKDFTKRYKYNIYQEKYRPQYHFSPPEMWMNDPNGMVYYKGEYHLFYQFHPDNNLWGPMHWGHAISKDLIFWEHLPVALEPDENGTIFSGSAVVDWNDSSGFFGGKPGLVAIFTHADKYPGTDRLRQRQSLAYSRDNGRTWIKYEDNPVLSDQEIENFRDPKVFWYEDTKSWIMIVVAGNHVRFYSSFNLKDWQYLSSFTGGARDCIWECPDIFKLPIEGKNDKHKWVLKVDINSGAPHGGSGAQYFIGEFDGTEFHNQYNDDTTLWLDYGKDYYAGVSWSDVPEEDGRRLWIAWMSNWQYAGQVPTDPWRGVMTFPRELMLTETAEGYRVIQKPIREIELLRTNAYNYNNIIVKPHNGILNNIYGDTLEIIAKFKNISSEEFGFKVRQSDKEETIVGYDTLKNHIFIDRDKSGRSEFHDDFAGKHFAELIGDNEIIKMHILVDSSSVELFVNDGLVSITDLIFPAPESRGLELYVKSGEAELISLKINILDGIWN